MSANIEQIKAMLERTGKTNLLQKQKVDLDKERLQLEATVNREKIDKSPEVDLEKEIDKYFSKWVQGASDEGCFNAESQLVSIYDCHRIARHFYELGKNSRKEK